MTALLLVLPICLLSKMPISQTTCLPACSSQHNYSLQMRGDLIQLQTFLLNHFQQKQHHHHHQQHFKKYYYYSTYYILCAECQTTNLTFYLITLSLRRGYYITQMVYRLFQILQKKTNVLLHKT